MRTAAHRALKLCQLRIDNCGEAKGCCPEWSHCPIWLEEPNREGRPHQEINACCCGCSLNAPARGSPDLSVGEETPPEAMILMQCAPFLSSSLAARLTSASPSHTRPMPLSAAPHAHASSPLPLQGRSVSLCRLQLRCQGAVHWGNVILTA